MFNHSCLQSIYRSQNKDFASESYFQNIVHNYFLTGKFDAENLDLKALRQFPLSEENTVKTLKNLLVTALIVKLSKEDSNFLLSNAAHQSILNLSWNQKSRYETVLVALNQFLYGRPFKSINWDILSGGAVPFELREYCSWEARPYSPSHAEFGTLLCLLAYLTNNENLKLEVLNIAKWHLNTLDSDFFPSVGLFLREKNGAISSQVMWNYIFFYSLSRLMDQEEYGDITEKYVRFSKSLAIKDCLRIDPLLPLLEKMINLYGTGEKIGSIKLSERICDPATALMGIRGEAFHSICTLHGGRTGLGSLRNKDVQILNYGPQYLPLENCEGFGIEGSRLSDHGVRQSSFDMNATGFLLKGCVRLVDKPGSSDENARLGELSGIWLEVEQEFNSLRFDLRTQFLGFDAPDGIAFSFFVKALSCRIGSRRIMPRELGRYEGEAHEVVFEGQEDSIRLDSPSSGTMQVIPLSGDDHFWGADFLVAYRIDVGQYKYNWQMHLESKGSSV